MDHEFRPCSEIAARAGIDKTSAAPALGYLRQAGRVESVSNGTASLWRRSGAGGL
jgi:hypothetical protein